MAFPVIASTGTGAKPGDGATADCTATTPSGVTAGDLLVALVQQRHNQPTATATDWTLVDSVLSTDFSALRLYSKVATGSDSYTWTSGTFDRIAIVVMRVTGASSSDPLPSGERSMTISAGTTSHDAASITTAGADRLVLRVYSSDFIPGDLTPSAGLTDVASASNENICRVWSEEFPTAGATGVVTFATTSTSRVRNATIALAPASGGPTVSIPALYYAVNRR